MLSRSRLVERFDSDAFFNEIDVTDPEDLLTAVLVDERLAQFERLVDGAQRIPGQRLRARFHRAKLVAMPHEFGRIDAEFAPAKSAFHRETYMMVGMIRLDKEPDAAHDLELCLSCQDCHSFSPLRFSIIH